MHFFNFATDGASERAFYTGVFMAYLGIALCFLPLIVCVLILTFGFKLKISHQMVAVLCGLVAVFPISLIQYFLPSLPIFTNAPVLHALLRSLFLYGLIEEIFKTVLLLPVPHKEYSELNFLLLSFVMGLALGCFESVVYYFDHLQIATFRGAKLLYGQIALRIVTSDLIHMTCTGLCGMFIFSCRNKPRTISPLVMAILLHGIFDFFAGFQNGLKYFEFAVVLLAMVECRIKYTSLKNLCENRLTIFY